MEGQESYKPPELRQEGSPYNSPEGLKNYLRKERQPVDYSQIISPSTRVLALGEEHSIEITKQEVLDHMNQFKELGFTHFGMEVFHTDEQQILDEYQKTGGGREDLVEIIKNGFGGYSKNATELYLKEVDEATRVGLRVVGIDLPESEQEYSTSDGMNTTDRLNKRDKRMTQAVQGILNENPKNKVLTFTGKGHVAKSGGTMANLLTNAGIEVASVNIDGGSSKAKDFFVESATNIGLAKDKFMAASLAKFPNSAMPYDWMIHLPQVEEISEDDMKVSGMQSIKGEVLTTNNRISLPRRGQAEITETTKNKIFTIEMPDGSTKDLGADWFGNSAEAKPGDLVSPDNSYDNDLLKDFGLTQEEKYKIREIN